MFSCIRRVCLLSATAQATLSNLKLMKEGIGVTWGKKRKTIIPRQFHVNIRSRSESTITKANGDEEEQLVFATVKAPPGASDSTVPGKIEWAKTVGSHVKKGEMVCTIRFRDGRSLDVSASAEGVIAVRSKKENDPIQHGDELFKIRLNPSEKFKKKKKRKGTSLEFDEEEITKLADHKAQSKQKNTQSKINPDKDSAQKATERPYDRNSQSSEPDAKAQIAVRNQYPFGESGNSQGIQGSFQVPPLMTTANEINIRGVQSFLETYDKSLYSQKPCIRSMYIRAAAFALKMKPTLNIKIHNNETIQKTEIDITMVMRNLQNTAFYTFKNVDKTSYFDIGRVITEIKRQMAGGTYRQTGRDYDFIISHEWEIGSVFGTPHYSNTCTLGLHKVVQRTTVEDTKITSNPIMYATLTYDNSKIHDVDAIDFLKMYKLAIEEPRYILVHTE